jgi:hypothetical protein
MRVNETHQGPEIRPRVQSGLKRLQFAHYELPAVETLLPTEPVEDSDDSL